MAGFSFPPPPPPPPRSSAPAPPASNSPPQHGGFNNSRGDRGGRGTYGGRGRGQSNNPRGRGQSRGGHGFQQPRNGQGGDRRQEHSGGGRGQHQQHGYNQAMHQQYSAHQSPPVPSNAYGQTPVPNNAYVNPAFFPNGMAPQMQTATPVQPQIDPMAFMQAFSTFMVNQAGTQNGVAPVPAPVHNQNQSSPPRSFGNNQFLPSSASGKRKRGADGGFQERRIPQSQENTLKKPKSIKVKASVAPTVPSFGLALPIVPKAVAPPPAPSNGKKDKKKAKKGNMLGLTPQIDHSDSEHESIDEEAAYGSGVTGLIFEYNGEVAALNSAAEVAAWLRERKKLYPTKARAEQKIQEERTRLANEQAILQRVKEEAEAKAGGTTRDKRKKLKKSDQKSTVALQDKRKQTEHERQLRRVEKLRMKLQRGEEMLVMSEGSLTSAQHQVQKELELVPDVEPRYKPTGLGPSKNSLGLNYDSDTGSTDEITDSNESSASDSDSESPSDSDSDSSSESRDSDAAPEVETSKARQPMRVAPPTDGMKRKTEQTICIYFKKNGKCTNRNCKFLHSPDMVAKEPKKRMSLFERMVEQEEKAADLLALQAIKYLGSSGFLS